MKYCLGTVQFGLDYGIQKNGQPSLDDVCSMLDFAASHSITYLDTASAYGNAEEVIGNFLTSRIGMASKVSVISKLPPNAFEMAQVGQWPGIAKQSALASIKKMHIRILEAYLFHNAAYIFNEDAVNAVSCVKQAGLAKKIGVSVYSPREALKALEYNAIDVIQIPYNVFDHRLDDCGFFQQARKRGVEIYARSSLLQGLAVMDPDSLPPNVTFASAYLRKFHEICKKYHIPPLNAAVGYVGLHKGIDFVVFGVDNIRQLSEYTAIKAQEIPAGLLAEIGAAFQKTEEKLVNPALWGK